MTSDDRFSFLLTALVAGAVILGTSRSGRQATTGLPDPPVVGAAPQAACVGPQFSEPDDSSPSAYLESGVEQGVAATLASAAWPSFATKLVLHPIATASLEEDGREHGAPYHLVVDGGGVLSWTARGRAGAPAQPSGLPAQAATSALHVAILDATRQGAARDAVVRALGREAARRLPAPAVVLADEVAGSTARLPEGVDRDAWIASQEESRPGATRPTTAPSRPSPGSQRIGVRFGAAELDVVVASTMIARRDGLGGRSTLRRDEGLLFVYPTSDHRSFWMKNCQVALDILYLDDFGHVLALTTMQPPDPKVPEATLPRFTSPAPCRLVLEVAAGTAAANGVRRGSKIGFPKMLPRLFATAEP